MTPETLVLSAAASAATLVFVDFLARFVGWWRSRRKKGDPSVDEVLPACRYELPDGTVVRVVSVETRSRGSKWVREVNYHVDDEWFRWQEELEVDAAAAEPQTFTVERDAFIAKCRPYVEVAAPEAGTAPAGALSVVRSPKHFKFHRRRRKVSPKAG